MVSSLLDLDPSNLSSLSDDDLAALASYALKLQADDRNTNQLRYYIPVSQKAIDVHKSTASVFFLAGGNGASKTDTALVDMVICATGIIPDSLKSIYPLSKFRGPINCRVVVESITNTLETIILPKLKWWNWQGVDEAGGIKGHYGWIPQFCLKKGEWDKSWTARTRTLEIRYHDPVTGKYRGISRIQFMSYDQDPSDFASGDFHLVLHDEPPKQRIWTENLVRTARVKGRMFLSMTWPDDPTIPVDWLIDEVYNKCLPGKDRDEHYEMVEMYATENKNLDQDAIAQMAKNLSAAERATRIYGQHLRLANRVHPLFTDSDHVWCFECNDLTLRTEDGACGTCSSSQVTVFNHVDESIEANPLYPVVKLLDPHPRKPHMLLWAQITPDDDIEVIHEVEVEGSPDEVALEVGSIESDYGWRNISNYMDPNMGRSPASTDRQTTWQDAFETAGLRFDLADDGEAGRQFLNDYLKPDPFTKRPRITFHPRNTKTIFQMKRYSWEDHKRALEKDQKQKVKQKNDDFPTLLKYLMNSQPSFRGLKSFGVPITIGSGRSNGY